MLLNNRHGSVDSEAYRYGFNGKENDDEVSGEGNMQDYGFRNYKTRIARFLSIDPLTKKYPQLSPFQFASNGPIANTDLDGLEAQYSAVPREDGTAHIKVTVDIDVFDVSGQSNIDRNAAKAAIKSRLENSFQASDAFGNQYSLEVNYGTTTISNKPRGFYTGLVLEFTSRVVDKSTGIPRPKGVIGRAGDNLGNGIGGTQQNIFQVLTGRATSGIARTGAHEIGHGMSLRHPYDPSTNIGDPLSIENDGVAQPINLISQTSVSPNGILLTMKQIDKVITEISIDRNQYFVKRGDNLSNIADRFGTTAGTLQKINSLEDPDKILVGQELKIK